MRDPRVMQRRHFSLLIAFLLFAHDGLSQVPAPSKAPVGVPPDATLFNGKWYRVFLEKGSWKLSREKCARLGGQLAVVHDTATQAFIEELAKGLQLWLGATDEKVEGLWIWVDGTPMSFKVWERNEPNNGSRREHYLQVGKNGPWNDGTNEAAYVVGFICEWKQR